MKHMFVLTLATIFVFPVIAMGIPQRVIYTFHLVEKTWNEARDICEKRLGQLIKFKDKSQEEEVLYLATQYSFLPNGTMSSRKIWTGNHVETVSQRPVYQDCQNSTTAITGSPAAGHLCVSANYSAATYYSYGYDDCSTKYLFMCERQIGDCWYEPFQDNTVQGDSSNRVESNVEETECALLCRNETDSYGSKCWAFSYITSSRTCKLHFLNETKFEREPSVAYLLEPKTQTDGWILYVRRCFEGEIDRSSYEEYEETNPSSTPKMSCSERDPEPVSHLCFCESNFDPPIPQPIPVEQKIEEIIKQLTVEPSNTSAALRKKISAEDNRPSAIGVGYMGAGLMAAVFGGLFLLDAPVLFAGVKKIICLSKANA